MVQLVRCVVRPTHLALQADTPRGAANTLHGEANTATFTAFTSFVAKCFQLFRSQSDKNNFHIHLEKFSKFAKNEVKAVKVAVLAAPCNVLATPCGVSAVPHGVLAAQRGVPAELCGVLA